MKRFLSWCQIVLFFSVFYYLMHLYVRIAQWANEVAISCGTVIYIVLFLSIGITILCGFVALPVFGAFLSVFVSQKIYKSKRGARYIVSAVLHAGYYLFFVLGIAGGVFIHTAEKATWYIILSCNILFAIVVAVYGRIAAKEDGAPPSKREKLEAKLNKISEKEARDNAIRIIRDAELRGIDVKSVLGKIEEGIITEDTSVEGRVKED